MLKKAPYLFVIILISFLSGCSWFVKAKYNTPVLMKVEDASKEQLLNEINRFAKVASMNAKMDLKYEDISLANKGTKITYAEVNATFVVQRPANIFLKVDFLSADIAQMTSNGEKFRVAVLKGGSCGEKCKKFIIGTNNADYTRFEDQLKAPTNADTKEVSSFSNLRPQHFTDAILIRPTNSSNTYLQSTINQVEDFDKQKKVIRGYYLLDELQKDSNDELKVVRRFWFERVGVIRLARQQLFDAKGEIESDIVYGKEGNLANNAEYRNLPLQIVVTRPKDKYMITLNYQSPESVKIGNSVKPELFELKNTWGLQEVNLDDKRESTGKNSAVTNQ